MKITFDCSIDPDGTLRSTSYVDLDTAHPLTVTGIKGTALPGRPIDAIAALNADKTQLQAAGWLEPTSIPGHPIGTTRWDILCAEANKPTASPEVKALKLTAVPPLPQP